MPSKEAALALATAFAAAASKLDDLYDRHAGDLDKNERAALVREFEHHLFQEAPVVPAIWWHRIVVVHKQLRGWNTIPSHYVGQELTDVWLDR